MSNGNPVSELLAAMVYDTCWGNKWHRIATALEDLTDDDLGYQPVPNVNPPRIILRHAASCACGYGSGLGPRTDDPSEEESERLRGRRAASAAELVNVVAVSCRRLHARARQITDDQLEERSGVWGGRMKGFVLMDGAILHAAWHLAQVAMLCNWRRAEEAGPQNPAPGPAGTEPRTTRRDWSKLQISSRKDACLRLLKLAYEESTWHGLRRQVIGLSPDELAWSPFSTVWGPMIAIHVAHCKVIYADQAFGEGTLSWGDCDRVLGAPGDRPDGERMACILDRAQEFLVDHIASATDEAIERTYPMHHGVPHAGWQVASAMAQHDVWHGGQIALMRDAYRALTA